MTEARDASDYPVILRAIVGSRAHGLERDDSDYDYREVFRVPTSDLLLVPRDHRPKRAWDAQSRHTDDEAGWEVEHFLEMCGRGHPNALEILFAPVEEADEDGRSLIGELRPHLLAQGKYRSSALGYAKNCVAKMVDPKTTTKRIVKWQVTYLRILWSGIHYLRTGDLPVDVRSYDWGHLLREVRDGEWTIGRTIDVGRGLEQELQGVESELPLEADWAKVNAWLLDLRQRRFYT